MGTRNAAVFPEPVLAMATTSLPSITSGIHCIQKAKGVENNLIGYRKLYGQRPPDSRVEREDIRGYLLHYHRTGFNCKNLIIVNCEFF